MNWLWITPFAAGLFCVFIFKLVAFFSGWERLAKEYRLLREFEGRLYKWRSARIKWANYDRCLNVGCDTQGLYLAPILLFRLFHEPLLIPWTEIHAYRVKRFLVNGYKLKFQACPGLTVLLHGSVFQRCLDQIDSSLVEKVLLKPPMEQSDL